ncbi:anti-sigma factor [Nocardioides sambongensis]|uniref:anti-sigma factor n=1 Tax=Nocardioides sambongensis TaxID=2589074 RepID=UPI0015E87502|nr:anti-sigma factor [Nocardioides sambongensis]
MTDHDQNLRPGELPAADLHRLSGAYAVDALDDMERARFERHLADCADCRAEVAELQETATLLATDEVAPPPDLRAAVLAGIETVRPLPPVAEPARPVEPARPAAAGRRSHRRVRWTHNRMFLAAAAVVLIALAAGTVWIRPWAGDGGDTIAAPTTTERVLEADDATRVRQDFPDGSTATVVVSRSEGRAVIVTEDMAAAPSGRVYQLWLQTPEGSMQPAGLMPDAPDATLLLDGDAADATAVGITVEPDGGSREPSSDPIALFTLET